MKIKRPVSLSKEKRPLGGGPWTECLQIADANIRGGM